MGTGRLGNQMCTYANLIALHWRLGHKIFLPHMMNSWSPADEAKPYLASVFRNVTFPTATWNYTYRASDARGPDQLLFNNSRTGGKLLACPHKPITKVDNVAKAFASLKCREEEGTVGSFGPEALSQKCDEPGPTCTCESYWVSIATGANYPAMEFIGPVLREIVEKHFQFVPKIQKAAESVVSGVVTRASELMGRKEEDVFLVGIHVRRTDFVDFAKWWLIHQNGGNGELFNATFYQKAQDHFRATKPGAVFLVVSDDLKWCREHLSAPDTFMVGGNSGEVDLAVMGNCHASIIGLWGAVLAGGETVVSTRTFRDVRWAADYLKWTYI